MCTVPQQIPIKNVQKRITDIRKNYYTVKFDTRVWLKRYVIEYFA